MQTRRITALVATLLVTATVGLVAQGSATNNLGIATITLQQGIAITKDADMTFGTHFTGSGVVENALPIRWTTTHAANATVQVSFTLPTTLDNASSSSQLPFSCPSGAGGYTRGTSPVLNFDPAVGFTSNGGTEPGTTMSINIGNSPAARCTVNVGSGAAPEVHTGTITITATLL